jgi:hypothetical protein
LFQLAQSYKQNSYGAYLLQLAEEGIN